MTTACNLIVLILINHQVLFSGAVLPQWLLAWPPPKPCARMQQSKSMRFACVHWAHAGCSDWGLGCWVWVSDKMVNHRWVSRSHICTYLFLFLTFIFTCAIRKFQQTYQTSHFHVYLFGIVASCRCRHSTCSGCGSPGSGAVVQHRRLQSNSREV